MSDESQPTTARFGKYRGRVVDNQDPLRRGRVLVEIPSATASAATWALPCVPYAGPGVGFHMIPPIGADVWVEFEGGDLDHPIWVGCFWAEQQLPDAATGPDRKVIATERGTVIIDDDPGSGGITITTDEAAIIVEPNRGITIRLPDDEIALADLRRRRPRTRRPPHDG